MLLVRAEAIAAATLQAELLPTDFQNLQVEVQQNFISFKIFFLFPLMPCWTFLFRALSSQVTLQLSEPGTVWCEMLRLSAAMQKIKRFCDVVVIDV